MTTEEFEAIFGNLCVGSDDFHNKLFGLYDRIFMRFRGSSRFAILAIYHYGRIEGIRAERRKRKAV